MVAAIAELALRRPWALLGANAVVLAGALALAVTAPDHLGVGSLDVNGGREAGRGGDLVIATTGNVPVRSPVYRVALDVITSQARTDPAVASVRRGSVSRNGRSTSLLVRLTPSDAGDRQEAVMRLERRIDPGPLRVAYGGESATILDARHELAEDLWRLELLALPLAALVLIAAFGARLAAAPVICSATAIAGALAGLRVVGGVAHLSLLGIAPAAVVGLVLGIELPGHLVVRFREEPPPVSRPEALRGAIRAAVRAGPAIAAAVVAGAIGVVATPLDQGPSIVLACGLAAAFATASAVICVPALLALGEIEGEKGSARRTRLSGVPGAVTGFLARSRLRTIGVSLLAVALMLAAAAPLRDARSAPFSAADLPRGAEARAAAAMADEGTRGQRAGRARPASGSATDQSLFPKLPLAAGISAAALLLVLLAAFRTPRVVPVAIVSMLPAAAACGLAVVVLQQGHLASAIGLSGQGALETGAVASLLAALAAISGARSVIAAGAARDERALASEPERVAKASSRLVVPPAATATVIAAAAAGVLAGTDLYSAKEFGPAIAAGLLIDLVLLRVPLAAWLARWG